MLKTLKVLKERAEKEGKMPKEKMLPYLKIAEKIDGGGVKGLGPKQVVVTGSKIVTGRDYYTKQERQEIALFVEHNGKEYQYRKPILEQTKDEQGHLLPKEDRDLHYFITSLIRLGIDKGDELVLEYKRSGKTGFISIQKPGEDPVDVEDPGYEDIPVIEAEDYAGGSDTTY